MSEARANRKSPVRMATELPHRALALGGPAAHGGLVHDVVVVQRGQVGQLARPRPPGSPPGAAGRRTARPAARAAAGTACRRRRQGGGRPRRRTGVRCSTARSAPTRRAPRPSASDAPSSPSGSQGPIVDAGVEPGARRRRRVTVMPSIGTGSDHQPTKRGAWSARSSTGPGRRRAPAWRRGDRERRRGGQPGHADRRAVRAPAARSTSARRPAGRRTRRSRWPAHRRPARAARRRPRAPPEHRELADEAAGQRDAGEREQEQAKRRRSAASARPSPAQLDRWVASPSSSRTSVTTANAAIVVKP